MRKRGFTIVELLIVIVVIAILATITIAAYNGIQQRANNTQRIAAAKQWYDSIVEYPAANQAYPAGAVGNIFCIGENNPTNLDANSDVDCGVTGNIKHDTSLTATFNNAIKTVRSSLPVFPSASITYDSGLSVTGMLMRAFDTNTTTSVAGHPTLIFALDGSSQDCILRPLASTATGGNFTVLGSSAVNSYSGATGTLCRVVLPDPTKL